MLMESDDPKTQVHQVSTVVTRSVDPEDVPGYSEIRQFLSQIAKEMAGSRAR